MLEIILMILFSACSYRNVIVHCQCMDCCQELSTKIVSGE